MILATILIVGFGYIIADLIICHAENDLAGHVPDWADDPVPAQLLNSTVLHATRFNQGRE